jgi:hypothetical protein
MAQLADVLGAKPDEIDDFAPSFPHHRPPSGGAARP